MYAGPNQRINRADNPSVITAEAAVSHLRREVRGETISSPLRTCILGVQGMRRGPVIITLTNMNTSRNTVPKTTGTEWMDGSKLVGWPKQASSTGAAATA